MSISTKGVNYTTTLMLETSSHPRDMKSDPLEPKLLSKMDQSSAPIELYLIQSEPSLLGLILLSNSGLMPSTMQ